MAEYFILSDRSWLWAGTLLYTLGFLFGLTALLRGKRPSQAKLFAIVLAGFVLQTIGLYARGLEVGSCPLGNTFEITQFVVWSLVLLYMAVGPVFRMSLLGFFASGLAAVLGLVSLSVIDWDGERKAHVFGPNLWIELHASLAIFSYGIFAILALTCIMYLVQNNSLKRKKMKGLSPFLPSILQLDQMILRLLTTGVIILTFSLILGSFYWFKNLDSVNWPKLTVTIAIWIAYLILASLRLQRRVVAHTLAWTCILLFLITLASIWPVASSSFQTTASISLLLR
ncbi:MAG TPA: cytochrome c biogenesis protein CcsA [Opitutales bacterium]|nr:cytochrome c biogenesis protein CcsA [Opitutales bacterium]